MPTSAAIVLEHFGRPTAPRELKTLSRKREYDPTLPFDDFTITLFPDLIAALVTLGFAWRIQTFPNNPRGARDGLRALKESIDLGNPVYFHEYLEGGHSVGADHAEDAVRAALLHAYLKRVLIEGNRSAP